MTMMTTITESGKCKTRYYEWVFVFFLHSSLAMFSLDASDKSFFPGLHEFLGFFCILSDFFCIFNEIRWFITLSIDLKKIIALFKVEKCLFEMEE